VAGKAYQTAHAPRLQPARAGIRPQPGCNDNATPTPESGRERRTRPADVEHLLLRHIRGLTPARLFREGSVMADVPAGIRRRDEHRARSAATSEAGRPHPPGLPGCGWHQHHPGLRKSVDPRSAHAPWPFQEQATGLPAHRCRCRTPCPRPRRAQWRQRARRPARPTIVVRVMALRRTSFPMWTRTACQPAPSLRIRLSPLSYRMPPGLCCGSGSALTWGKSEHACHHFSRRMPRPRI